MQDEAVNPPDLDEMAQLTGCTPMQMRYAWHRSQGASQVEAAHDAGYAGDRFSVQLRTTASNTERSEPVQAAIALIRQRGLSTSDEPGDLDELYKILWKHARGKDKAHSINASKELIRLEEVRAVRQEPERSPEEILADLRALAPAVADALEYSLATPEDRKATLRKLIHENPSAAQWYLRELHPGAFGNGREAS
jgi:hypothetical protein